MTAGKAKRTLSYFSYQFGLTQGLVKLQEVLKTEKLNTFRILKYHRVNDFKDPFTIDSVPAADFEYQMQYLLKYYHVLSLEDIYDHIKSNRNLPKQCMAITFDDGYEDNYTYAFKILKKYGLPATIFVIADCVNSQTPLWFDRVLSAFKATNKKKFVCPISENVFDIQSIEEKLGTAHVILEKLKKANNEQRKRYVTDIVDELGISSIREVYKNSKLLNWSQIKEMTRNKISIGSHTMTHPILTSLPFSEMQWELMASRQIIEQNIGEEVLFLAYPNGKSNDYNENVIQSTKKAGYKAAMTTAPGINNSTTDLFTWGRYKPWDNRVEHFSMALFVHGITG